jgi:hypothetical protein
VRRADRRVEVGAHREAPQHPVGIDEISGGRDADPTPPLPTTRILMS